MLDTVDDDCTSSLEISGFPLSIQNEVSSLFINEKWDVLEFEGFSRSWENLSSRVHGRRTTILICFRQKDNVLRFSYIDIFSTRLDPSWSRSIMS